MTYHSITVAPPSEKQSVPNTLLFCNQDTDTFATETGQIAEMPFDTDIGDFASRSTCKTIEERPLESTAALGFAQSTEAGQEPKPIVYAYQEDLQAILDSGQKTAIGIAGEWPGEQVFHAFRNYPKTHFSGLPLACLFEQLSKEEDFLNAKYDEERNTSGKRKINIVFWLTNGKLFAKCFLWEREKAVEAELRFVPSKSKLFSRAEGILEVGILEDKRVLVVGLGSFGSQIAVEFAKAGVGHFTLVDFDRVELHNVARHVCGVNEMGRLKTNAIRDAILVKNPFADVETFDADITVEADLCDQLVAKADLTICATDNNLSRGRMTSSVLKSGKTALFGRAYSRAEGGDIVRFRPGGPCYFCRIPERSEEPDLRNLPAYSSKTTAVVQVGLSSDIAPICNMMVKLGLVELSRGVANAGLSGLAHELRYDYYFWANRREEQFANFAAFDALGHMPRILRWYGANMTRNPGCSYCGTKGQTYDHR